MMKTMIALMAALALSGCSSHEDMTNTPQRKIRVAVPKDRSRISGITRLKPVSAGIAQMYDSEYDVFSADDPNVPELWRKALASTTSGVVNLPEGWLGQGISVEDMHKIAANMKTPDLVTNGVEVESQP